MAKKMYHDGFINGFYHGMLNALAVIKLYDNWVLYGEVIAILSDEEFAELLVYATRNDELETSGLKIFLTK